MAASRPLTWRASVPVFTMRRSLGAVNEPSTAVFPLPSGASAAAAEAAGWAGPPTTLTPPCVPVPPLESTAPPKSRRLPALEEHAAKTTAAAAQKTRARRRLVVGRPIMAGTSAVPDRTGRCAIGPETPGGPSRFRGSRRQRQRPCLAPAVSRSAASRTAASRTAASRTGRVAHRRVAAPCPPRYHEHCYLRALRSPAICSRPSRAPFWRLIAMAVISGALVRSARPGSRGSGA